MLVFSQPTHQMNHADSGVVLAAAEVEEGQACLDLAELILETSKRVDQRAHASLAAGKTCHHDH